MNKKLKQWFIDNYTDIEKDKLPSVLSGTPKWYVEKHRLISLNKVDILEKKFQIDFPEYYFPFFNKTTINTGKQKYFFWLPYDNWNFFLKVLEVNRKNGDFYKTQ